MTEQASVPERPGNLFTPPSAIEDDLREQLRAMRIERTQLKALLALIDTTAARWMSAAIGDEHTCATCQRDFQTALEALEAADLSADES